MGKKKFIDKKKAVTFSLLYRESNDGERVTNDRVYTRVDNNAVQIPGFHEEEEEEEDYNALKEFDVDSMFADAEEDDKEHSSREGKGTRIQLGGDSQKGQLPDNIRKELLEMGFPDDGYNYMKHLRSFGVGVITPRFVPNQAPILPTDIKAYDASKLKLANANESDSLQVSTSTRQIRRPSIANDGFDPEVAAALDDEGSIFDSADELEDDFLVNANEFSPTTETQDPADKANDIEGFSSVANVEDTEWDGDNCSEEVPTAEATRSLRLLDEQFEMLALREYEGDEIEDLEDNDLLAQGCMDVSKFDAVLSEFLNDTSFFAEKYETVTNSSLILDEGKKPDIRKLCLGSKDEGIVQVDHKGVSREDHKNTSESIHSLSETDETEEETEDVWVEDSDHEEQWDCETIVSTYSNLENHPCKIVTPGNPGKARLELDTIKIKASTNQMIKLAGKQKLPVDFLPSKGIEKKPSQVKSEVGVHGHPKKKAGPRGGETAEERKCRKAALKEERRLARITKKEFKGQYKNEARKAQVGAATTGPPAIHLP